MYAYYKAMPSTNPLVTDKIYKRSIQKHKKKLQNAKCSVDNKPPSHWRNKPKRNLKKEQMAEDRYTSIERENRLLLEKMAKIMQESHELSPEHAAREQKRAQTPKSLNIVARQREVKRIAKQNRAILERLQKSEPTYSALKWELERQQHEHYLKNIVIHKGSRPSTAKKTKRIIIKKTSNTKSMPNLTKLPSRPSTAPGPRG